MQNPSTHPCRFFVLSVLAMLRRRARRRREGRFTG
jgi:hypothetical protein